MFERDELVVHRLQIRKGKFVSLSGENPVCFVASYLLAKDQDGPKSAEAPIVDLLAALRKSLEGRW